MLESITGADLVNFGLPGTCVLLVLLGLLIPRWVHTQRVNDLKEANALLQAANEKRDAQVDQLVEGQRTTIQLLESIRSEAAARREAA